MGTPAQNYISYLNTIKGEFVKLARLDFLQPDGTIAFSLNNKESNKRSGAFIQDGELSVSLQNGQRRTATVLLANLDGEYDYNINKIWFGQRIRLMMGVLLPDGTEYYIPQGVFYVSNPTEAFTPTDKSATFNLVDKWAYLDGTLFGNLDGTYEVALNENIFGAMQSILNFPIHGYNGSTPVGTEVIDDVKPLFTNYYNGTPSRLLTPYTYRCDSSSGSYADIMLELNTMIVGWIGYDRTGRLVVDAAYEDLLDTDKPVLWEFSPEEKTFLGINYTVKNSEVYNDILVIGETLTDTSSVPQGRAVNRNTASDTSIYSSLGRRTKIIEGTGYYSDAQCQELAQWHLKRYSILQKSVTIECTQLFHIVENQLVSVKRTDKAGSPVEKHLVSGFTIPISQTGTMTINATSVNDLLASAS